MYIIADWVVKLRQDGKASPHPTDKSNFDVIITVDGLYYIVFVKAVQEDVLASNLGRYSLDII